MKRILRFSLLFLLGSFAIASCSEQKTGNGEKQKITEEIKIEKGVKVADTALVDSAASAQVPSISPEPVRPVDPPAPIPRREPRDPWYDPEPFPDPVVLPPPMPINVPIPKDTNEVVDFPDVEPEFVGGAKAMLKFIVDNIRYPDEDMELGNQGTVYVEFIVERDGSITNEKVIRGSTKLMDEEALRVVGIMPKWNPGEVKGKPVRCRSRLPIRFMLQ